MVGSRSTELPLPLSFAAIFDPVEPKASLKATLSSSTTAEYDPRSLFLKSDELGVP